MRVSSIDCRRLRKIIRKECGSCLIVDCRPYFSFSNSNITGSFNVNLNSVVVRRSRGGPVPLQFVIPDEKALYRLREGSISAVVALDDRTPHFQKLRKDSVAQIVINTLTASGANICFLKGGYENFHSQYPELCTEMKVVTPTTGTETERAIRGHCEKLRCNLKPDYDQGPPVELAPFLYLGSAYHASRHDFLSERRITALLNVSKRDTAPAKWQYDYKWIPVEDSHTADISSHFQEAFDFIDRVKQGGGKVLVHCEAGISRSPTICMAYLMRTRSLRLEEAFDVIRQQRAMISPNFSFMGQLLQFEAEVLSSAPPASSSSAASSMDSSASTHSSSISSSPVFSFSSSSSSLSSLKVETTGSTARSRPHIPVPLLLHQENSPTTLESSMDITITTTINTNTAKAMEDVGVETQGSEPPPTPAPRGPASPPSFFSDAVFELGGGGQKSWEESSPPSSAAAVFSFPTSFLSPLPPLQSVPPVRHRPFKLSPITALP
ncbi:dual specificity protein phosphatase 5 [Engraulis encrasicolus]|uniref:dual specificity protein phosphatase 5 n=1 Tax=Engraulis encrasicolus TaxID=184585 RepID=UPI002FD17415